MDTRTRTCIAEVEDKPRPEALAECAGLRHVDDSVPGIRRVRSGEGFSYVDAGGKAVRDEETLARISGLVIPPAWTDVWICAFPDGHVQATGRDARGRKQYLYHERWQEVRDEAKFHRMVAFGEALPALRRATERDLESHGLKRDRVLGLVVRLLDDTLIRVGNREYRDENESFGLTTLTDDQVRVAGEKVRFRFRGKAGKEHEIDLQDARLARLVKRVRDLPGQELFQYVDESGEQRVVGSEEVNDYLHEVAGDSFTSKDFRTWGGTVLAATALREAGEALSKRDAERRVVDAVKQACALLGNTPAVARRSYVHPGVIDLYFSGRMPEVWERATERARRLPSETRRWLRPEEAVVLELLREM